MKKWQIVTSIVVALVAVLSLSVAAFAQGMSQRAVQVGAIAAGAIGITLLGLLDDRHTMSAKKKFSGQLAVALLLVAADVRIELFLPGVWLSYAVTVLWVLTVLTMVALICLRLYFHLAAMQPPAAATGPLPPAA